MRNIKLTIEYDGTDFFGWQTQKNQRTVQETIEKELRVILGEKVNLTGSGRTDSGVHAKALVANFKTKSSLPAEKIKKALNARLSEDITIIDAQPAPVNFNARFSAKSKVYRYTINNSHLRIAINRQYACHLPYHLNVRQMKKEAAVLIGRKNFKSFHASGRKLENFRRHIKRIDIKKDKSGFITIDIEADGFLYNMVRNIVGTLVEVGRGKMPAGSTKKILAAENRQYAGPTMPAKGLCLLEVKY